MTEQSQFKLKFQEYSFFDALKAIEPYLKDNYSFKLDTMEGYPQVFGNVHTFILVNEGSTKGTNVNEDTPEVNTATVTTVKRKTKTE
jgi:hypothetical protein